MQLAFVGAHSCIAQSDGHPRDGTGLVLGSSHGNLADTVRLVDDAIERLMPPMPFSFINVTSNLAGFHVANSLSIQGGPNIMVSRGQGSFSAAIELALLEPERPWLIGICDEVPNPPEAHAQRLQLPHATRLAEATYWIWTDPDCVSPPGRLIYIRTCSNNDELQDACNEVSRKLHNHSPTWAAARTEADYSELQTVLPASLKRWQPTAAGYHPCISARVLCGFLAQKKEGSLIYAERDHLTKQWQVIAISTYPSTTH
ncbi:hypothetical protein LRD18_03475 [Halorhodospira halochloris]|nr:hypothetical protein [Halorhodospira halochloris]